MSSLDGRLKMVAVYCFFGGLVLAVYLLPIWPLWLALLAIPAGAAAAYGVYCLSHAIEKK